MKILVVDDDPMAAEMIAAVLEDNGHEVILTDSAIAAMELFNTEQNFAVIISDMNMPLVSGIELFQTLREQGITTPFILLTGDEPEPFRTQEPGLDECLKKDFDLDMTLPEALQRLFPA